MSLKLLTRFVQTRILLFKCRFFLLIVVGVQEAGVRKAMVSAMEAEFGELGLKWSIGGQVRR